MTLITCIDVKLMIRNYVRFNTSWLGMVSCLTRAQCKGCVTSIEGCALYFAHRSQFLVAVDLYLVLEFSLTDLIRTIFLTEQQSIEHSPKSVVYKS